MTMNTSCWWLHRVDDCIVLTTMNESCWWAWMNRVDDCILLMNASCWWAWMHLVHDKMHGVYVEMIAFFLFSLCVCLIMRIVNDTHYQYALLTRRITKKTHYKQDALQTTKQYALQTTQGMHCQWGEIICIHMRRDHLYCQWGEIICIANEARSFVFTVYSQQVCCLHDERSWEVIRGH